MSKTRRSGRFEDIDAIKVQILFLGLGHDSSKTVGKHTGEGAIEEDGSQSNEEDEKWWSKTRVNQFHNIESDASVSVENLGDIPCHLSVGESISSKERKCGQETKIDYNNQDHKLEEVFAHLFQTGDDSAPVRTQAEE